MKPKTNLKYNDVCLYLLYVISLKRYLFETIFKYILTPMYTNKPIRGLNFHIVDYLA